MSSPRSCSSSADVSTVMPLAYSSTAPSRCARSHGTCWKSRWCAASRSARYRRISSAGVSSPWLNAAMPPGSRAAVSDSGRPMSVEPTTSRASEPRAWPICWPTIMPPICLHHAHQRPGHGLGLRRAGPRRRACRPWSRPCARRSGRRACCHTGTVFSIHSDRLHACGLVTPLGSVGRLVEPQIGETQRLDDLAALAFHDARVALGDHGVPGDVLRHVPVDGAGARWGADSMSANWRMAAAICSGLPNMANGFSLGSFSRPGRSVTALPRAGWRSPHPPRYRRYGGSVQSEDLVPTSKRSAPPRSSPSPARPRASAASFSQSSPRLRISAGSWPSTSSAATSRTSRGE